MSNEFTPVNPYAAPDAVYAPQFETNPTPRLSGWYTFVVITGMILGGMGIAAALMAGVGIAAGMATQGFAQPGFPGGGNVSPELVEAQQELNDKVNAVTKRYMPISISLTAGHLLVAAALLGTSILAMKQSRVGVKWLLIAFGVAVAFEVIRLVFTLFQQMEIGQIMRDFFEVLIEEGGKSSPQQGEVPKQFLASIMSVGLGIGVCAVVGWVLIKIAFYVFGITYLRKPQVQTLLKP